jgi:hypothetical protein
MITAKYGLTVFGCQVATSIHQNVFIAPILMHNPELNQYQHIPQIPPSIAKHLVKHN